MLVSLLRRACVPCAVLLGALACTPTADSLGRNDPADAGTLPPPEVKELVPLVGPSFYSNEFRYVLLKSDAEIQRKLNSAFQQLFYGDEESERIYFPQSAEPTHADIVDLYHMETRTEGIGLGMLITVQLDKQDEFDRLWRGAKARRISEGPKTGYYDSYCDFMGSSDICTDPFGMEMYAMSLIFAHGRWGSAGGIDYEADALELLERMQNGPPVDAQGSGFGRDVTPVFDPETKLVLDQPNREFASFTRPSIVMPGFYRLWAEATGNQFWLEAADAGRAYLSKVSDAETGLMPLRAFLAGYPHPQFENFSPEAYRAQLHVVIDRIWWGETIRSVEICNKLIRFFAPQGEECGTEYALDGTMLNGEYELALVIVNGATAVGAHVSERKEFMQRVWDMPIPSGDYRYYQGILYLLSLLILSGELRVY